MLRRIARFGTIVFAALCLLFGGLALGLAYLPEHGIVLAGHDALVQAALRLSAVEALGLPVDSAHRAERALGIPLLRLGLAPFGLVLLVAALLPGRSRSLPETAPEHTEEQAREEIAPVDPKEQKKAQKTAAGIAKKGRPLEAAEYAFASGLLDQAAHYFIDAQELVRAAEIRHDQNRFMESAELYLKAERYDSAGSIFSQQEEYGRAGEAYLLAGNKSVAAEMFERGEEFKRAADCYAESGFPREAAKAYIRC